MIDSAARSSRRRLGMGSCSKRSNNARGYRVLLRQHAVVLADPPAQPGRIALAGHADQVRADAAHADALPVHRTEAVARRATGAEQFFAVTRRADFGCIGVAFANARLFPVMQGVSQLVGQDPGVFEG